MERRCESCAGLGRVGTGTPSSEGGEDFRICPECDGDGWVDPKVVPAATGAPAGWSDLPSEPGLFVTVRRHGTRPGSYALVQDVSRDRLKSIIADQKHFRQYLWFGPIPSPSAVDTTAKKAEK